MICTKLYPRLYLYHFLKFWKKYTTLALFLNGRFTQKRTETKLTKQNKAKALVWNFFPQPAVGDIQLLFNISPLIILCWGQKILQIATRFFAIFPRFHKKAKNWRFSRDFYLKTGLPPQFSTLGKIWSNFVLCSQVLFYKKMAIFSRKIAKSLRFLKKCAKIAKFAISEGLMVISEKYFLATLNKTVWSRFKIVSEVKAKGQVSWVMT